MQNVSRYLRAATLNIVYILYQKDKAYLNVLVIVLESISPAPADLSGAAPPDSCGGPSPWNGSEWTDALPSRRRVHGPPAMGGSGGQRGTAGGSGRQREAVGGRNQWDAGRCWEEIGCRWCIHDVNGAI